MSFTEGIALLIVILEVTRLYHEFRWWYTPRWLGNIDYNITLNMMVNTSVVKYLHFLTTLPDMYVGSRIEFIQIF